MSHIDEFIVQLKRGETAPTRALRDIYRWLLKWNMPQSRLSKRVFGTLYRAHHAYEATAEYATGKFLYEPMVRARLHSVGPRLRVGALPYINGHSKITVGSDCSFGYFAVSSGRFVDQPELIIGDRVNFSHAITLVVNKRITIGNDVGVAGRCWISDSDGHPGSPERRERGETLTEDDIRPVTIEDRVWLGHGAHVLKGVTIGRGAVVAAGSVVATDVPAGALAMGVPARMIKTPW